ncbi:MAG: L-type lectin-domain containing protein [Phycisphaerales bacterium]
MKTFVARSLRSLPVVSAAAVVSLLAGSGIAHETGRLEYFDFTVASDLSQISVVGSAALTEDGRARLTPSAEGQAGALWHNQKQRLDQGFQLVFRYQVSDSFALGETLPGGDGADGIAFVIQGNSPDVVGNGGGDMGYAEIPNSLAVELDMWNNGEADNDPDGNHIGVQTRGAAGNSHFGNATVAQASPSVQLDDGEVHTVRIDYVPGTLRVFVDNLQVPVLVAPVDLTSLAANEGNPAGDNILDENGAAYIGFTSGTGGAFQTHDLLYFVLRTGEPCSIDYDGSNQIDPDDVGDFITDYYTFPPIAGPGGFAVSCPENEAPYDQGYKVNFTGDCAEPMPDTLGDFITAYFTGCAVEVDPT